MYRVLQYTEAKVDVTQEIEQRYAPAWEACCALCSISCVTSTLASVYSTSSVKKVMSLVIPSIVGDPK